ncbi:hypothetical protein [Chromatium okenii]|uniref:hypothetical protein n=1 Tax=Chromatium okenii TaxID=61644 RepID=UPI001903438D|nr:hypothetical protein [Chromatium okenii]
MANIPHPSQFQQQNKNRRQPRVNQPHIPQPAAADENAASGILFIAAIVVLFFGQFLLALILFALGFVVFQDSEDK